MKKQESWIWTDEDQKDWERRCEAMEREELEEERIAALVEKARNEERERSANHMKGAFAGGAVGFGIGGPIGAIIGAVIGATILNK